jgi:uncharacterized membrane protein
VLKGLLPGYAHLQNVHPLLVHFPLAFLPGAVLSYALAWVSRREYWAWAGLWMLALGTLGAAAAAASGLYSADGVMIARSVRANLLQHHKQLMLAVLALSAALLLWAAATRPWPARARAVFLGLLAAMMAGLILGADYGGRMVYDYNAGGNACPQPIEFQG